MNRKKLILISIKELHLELSAIESKLVTMSNIHLVDILNEYLIHYHVQNHIVTDLDIRIMSSEIITSILSGCEKDCCSGSVYLDIVDLTITTLQQIDIRMRRILVIKPLDKQWFVQEMTPIHLAIEEG